MSIRSILVHLADDPDCLARLSGACELARRQGARLTGLYTTEPLDIDQSEDGRLYADDCLDFAARQMGATLRAAEKRVEPMVAVLDRWGPHPDVRFTWTYEQGPVQELLARHSLMHDLLVVSQAVPDLQQLVFGDGADQVAPVVACPVLVLPRGYSGRPIDERVIVAWKPERECGLAVKAALPILEAAAEVTVLTVDGRDAAAVATYLDQHGVHATPQDVLAGDETVEEVLIHRATMLDASLVVMGGFAHGRLWERVIGSTTGRMLAETRTPLLMAH